MIFVFLQKRQVRDWEQRDGFSLFWSLHAKKCFEKRMRIQYTGVIKNREDDYERRFYTVHPH